MTGGEHERERGEIDGPGGGDETATDVPTVGVGQMLVGNRWALLLDVALPVVGYQLLVGRGVPAVVALGATALFPLLGTLGGWLRAR